MEMHILKKLIIVRERLELAITNPLSASQFKLIDIKIYLNIDTRIVGLEDYMHKFIGYLSFWTLLR